MMNSKIKYLLWLIVLFSTVLICGAFINSKTENFDLAKQEIQLRKIGHELLLQAGDSTSRVLPIIRISNHEYEIKFENQFSFKPDSLAKAVERSLAHNSLNDEYIVNVIRCSSNEVTYGYIVTNQQKEDQVTCSGRIQPKDCYSINIKFENSRIATHQNGYFFGGLGLVTSCTLLFGFAFFKQRAKYISPKQSHQISIGNTRFDFAKNCLIFGDRVTSLTTKESKILMIFAESPNTTVERSRLQKEIWEDEGVIVSRSLDMFISKLRKKLASDSSLVLTNIHGKGYKLEITPIVN